MSRIIVMAGGTGGHVFPALAVAECLRAEGAEVLWLGGGGLEAELAPAAGFEFRRIHIKGLRKSGFARALAFPFMLAWAVAQALWIFLRWRPDAALGMGGFVSGPGGLVAGLLRRSPLIIHEQNAIAGLTNRALARIAARALTGFPAAEGIREFTWAGNPVRREIAELPPPEERLGGRDGALRLLVVGGSLGARAFNEHLPALLARAGELPGELTAELQVRHQCGRGGADAVAARYRDAGVACEAADFIDDMAAAWAWCDVAICRAGAMTVAEVCAAGVAAILVPYPHAVNDHQSANAAYLASQDAARLLPQAEFIGGGWLAWLGEWRRRRGDLLAMAAAARKLAKPEAAAGVARACLEAANA